MTAPATPFDEIDLGLSLPLVLEQDGRRRWGDASGGVTLHYFSIPPDISCPIETDAIAQHYGKMIADSSAGMLEAQAIELAGIPSVRLLLKAVMNPATKKGRIYVGSYTLPFRDFSYVIKIQYAEQGMTGAREAVVVDELMAKGELEPMDDGGMQGWLTGEGPPHLAANRSEDPSYDPSFPDHPLSRVRGLMGKIEAGLKLSEAVRGAPGFVYEG